MMPSIHPGRTIFVALSAGILLFAACGDGGEHDNATVGAADTTNSDTRLDQAKNMLYLVPSPIETVMLLHRAGAQYDGTALNNVGNVEKYETNMERSVNLGIYGADLSYASMFDQTQEAMFYVTASKKLAEKLGIMNAFDQATIERMEDNINDRDSMLRIISDTYWIADSYLKENESVNTSALIIVGGWIEGLHIAAHVAKTGKNKEDLMEKIAEQKFALENLIAMLSTYEQTEDIKAVSTDLMSIKAEFDKLQVTEVNANDTVDENGMMVIGETNKIEITPAQFDAIVAQLETVRTKYVE